MKSGLAVIGLLVILACFINSGAVRANVSSWLGQCFGQTAYEPYGDQPYCADNYQRPAYQSTYQQQQYNRNVVINRTYAPQVYRRPVIAPVQYRPYYRAF